MHTMAFQLPRPCQLCGTMMERNLPNGVQCPQCGHKLFDPGDAAKCDCAKCQASG